MVSLDGSQCDVFGAVDSQMEDVTYGHITYNISESEV